MQGASSPFAVAPARPTVGQMAAVAEDLLARPSAWWHLVRFDGTPVCVPGAGDIDARLVAWERGFTPRHPFLAATTAQEVIAVVAGELSIGGEPLRPHRVRVRGGLHAPALANHGRGFAISLHVRALYT
jgi:hypothetical protein